MLVRVCVCGRAQVCNKCIYSKKKHEHTYVHLFPTCSCVETCEYLSLSIYLSFCLSSCLLAGKQYEGHSAMQSASPIKVGRQTWDMLNVCPNQRPLTTLFCQALPYVPIHRVCRKCRLCRHGFSVPSQLEKH